MTAVAVEPSAAAAIPRDPAWWGILLFIVTEATLFALLLVSYFYLRFEEPGPWPPAGDEPPKLLIPLIMTLLLMASSVPAYLADKSIRRGEVDRLRLYLASTLVLGAAFLGLQAFEYHSELDILRPQSDAYGSLFYTITSLHGAHVVVGLALLGWVLVWAFRNHYGADRHLAVEISSLYWHFVHVVWLFVFLSLYLSPRI
jgi:heme/copper-type cytochrome/quinol oxidase subunit 3